MSEQDLEDILRSFKLDVRIIGDEYKEKNYTGRDYCDEKGRVAVNHIASFENLDDEFVFLCNQVGMSSPGLQHGNKSSSLLKMTDIYDQGLIDLVAKKESCVIEVKGYTI